MLKIPTTIKQAVTTTVSPAFALSHLVNTPQDITADGTITIPLTITGTATVVTPADRNAINDITFNCLSRDNAGNVNQGIAVFTISVQGEWVNTEISDATATLTISVQGTFVPGITINVTDNPVELNLSAIPSADYISFSSAVKNNWIKWSAIGSLDFTIGKDNVAGERPLDWKGNIYAVKKLGNKVVAYGENGVSLLIPSGVIYGLETIYRIGLKGKNAVTGDNSKHFFVDNSGKLWKLSEGLQSLDYSEYLSSMNSGIVLSYDSLNNAVYICDGTVGYIYDVVTGSLGGCQPNITGMGYQSGIQYVAAPDDITTDPFQICTGIYDLGSRDSKTIFSLEIGTNVSTSLYAAVDYRRSKASNFVQTPWYTVSANGRVFIIAWGVEFKFRLKTNEYEYFEIDYIKVNGVNNAY